MTKVAVLAAFAFLGVAAVDALAVKGSNWNHCRGRERSAVKEQRAARRAVRRAAFGQAIGEGYISVASDGNGLDLNAETLGEGYHSPCQVNARNTGATSKVDVRDAAAPGLDPALQAHVQWFSAFLAGQYQTRAASRAAPLTFTGITIQSLRVRGTWRAIRNFTRIVGNETVSFTGTLTGGDSDGVAVSGSYRVQITRGDRAQ